MKFPKPQGLIDWIPVGIIVVGVFTIVFTVAFIAGYWSA